MSSRIVLNISESSIFFCPKLTRLPENYYPLFQLFRVAALMFSAFLLFSSYSMLVGLILQIMALFQSRESFEH